MPPSLPTGQLRPLPRFKCLNAANPRLFSTSAPLSAIGPESPRFIEIPTTRQPHAVHKQDIKGFIPPPRNLFPNRAGSKTSPEYFDATIRPPQNRDEPAPNNYAAWKRNLATNRRNNLYEGLQALRIRKDISDKKIAMQSRKKSEERERLLAAPQREDERLTNPTVRESMRIVKLASIPDPRRAERLVEKAERVKAKEARREEARKNALHTLYMHARSFITTEEQLDEEIEAIFVPMPFPDSSSNNIWDAMKGPKTVQDLLSEVNHTQKDAVAYHAGPAVITGERMKKIAEELTGGKMD